MRLRHFHNIKGVFFDLDGTLFDTAPELIIAVQKMFQELNLPPVSAEIIKSFIGKGAENLVRKSIEQASPKDGHQFFTLGLDLFYQFYDELVDQSIPFEGAEKALSDLSLKGLKLACVTNKPKQFTDKILKKHEMHKFLHFVISGDEVERKKPDPLSIQLTCNALCIRADESIMVGDSFNDIEAGYNAGSYVVTVPYGYQSGQSIDCPKVDLAVKKLTDLVTAIN